MNKEHLNRSLKKFKGNITEEQEQELVKKLSVVSDDKAEQLRNVKIKSVKCTVRLSSVLGLFGGGSFYLGQIKRGIAKCIFNVIVPLAVSLIFLFGLAPINHQYYNEGVEFQQFFNYSTPDLLHFNEYTYNGASLTVTDDEVEPQTLGHIDFISDINNSLALYSQALEDLKGFLSAISAQIPVLDNIAGDKDFYDKISAINAEFAALSDSANSLFDNLTQFKEAIEEVLTSEMLKEEILEEREEITFNDVIEKLKGKLSNVLLDNEVKNNEDLVKYIKSLSEAVDNLSATDTVNTYLESLNDVNFNNAVNVSSGLEDIHSVLKVLLEELQNPNLYDINATLQQLTSLINSVNWDDVSYINTLNSAKVSDDLQAKASYIVPEIFGSEEDKSVSVGELITLILADLDNLYAGSEEKPEILVETIAVLSELSEKYNSSSLESITKSLFPEQENEEDAQSVIVNIAAEFEASLQTLLGSNGIVNYGEEDKEVLINTVFNYVLAAADAGKLLIDYQFGVYSIYSSRVFSTCVTFTTSHVAATLLHYYTGLDVDFTFETGESLLYYYLSNSAPKSAVDEKLGITDAFRAYYSDAQNIINIIGDNIYLLSNLDAINESLNEMATSINNLSYDTAAGISKWHFNWKFIQIYFALMLSIDLLVIISYWIFEVHRDREKCYNMNYKTILDEMDLNN